MKIVTQWVCTQFGKVILEEAVAVGDAVQNKVATGVLHEIILLNCGAIDIPDLESKDD